jgi:hypothetical protein
MNTLSNYINERLNPRHLGSTDKFPIDGTIEEMASFLERQGFQPREDLVEKPPYFPETAVILNRAKDKIFIVEKDRWIRFCNTKNEKIGPTNPIYCVFNARNLFRETTGWKTERFASANEFLNEVNKHFRFQ